MKFERKNIDRPMLLSTSVSGITLLAWDATFSEEDAKQATEPLDLNVQSVHNNETQGMILLEEDRISHKDAVQLYNNLGDTVEYGKAQITSYLKEKRPFRNITDDDGDFAFTTRTYVAAEQQGGVPTEKDVGNAYSDLTEVMDLDSTKDVVTFGTHVMFIKFGDQAIEELGVDAERIHYASKLIEIENELLAGT